MSSSIQRQERAQLRPFAPEGYSSAMTQLKTTCALLQKKNPDLT